MRMVDKEILRNCKFGSRVPISRPFVGMLTFITLLLYGMWGEVNASTSTQVNLFPHSGAQATQNKQGFEYWKDVNAESFENGNTWLNAYSRLAEEDKTAQSSIHKYSATSFSQRREQFVTQFPLYDDTATHAIASKELRRFMNQTYLDYASSGVYQETQIKQSCQDLIQNTYGNAHSRNPSSTFTKGVISGTRALILDFFKAQPEDYLVVFTSGATGALKSVGEGFPWKASSKFYYTRINHNSVLGIREYAHLYNSEFRALSYEEVNQILESRKKSKNGNSMKNKVENYCLFAYPAKDNFVGEYYPLSWIEDIQKYGLSDDCTWSVLLDAAAYVSTNQLDLSNISPDFITVSLYKIFGYPTGLGVLLLRNTLSFQLKKTYFGGGTVIYASCENHWCAYKLDQSERLEDGTIPFLEIAAVKHGFDAVLNVGMERIKNNIASLTMYLAHELDKMRHANGMPVVRRYGSTDRSDATGGIVSFNVLRPDGNYINFIRVEQEAAKRMIHLRTGCFCNPGACQDFLGLTLHEVQEAAEYRESCSDPSTPLLHNKPMGAVRVSLGYLSLFEDIEELLDFIRTTYMH